MIVFHEGLPGSGKSYESVVMHIIPALKAGRDVLTNINGINHEKLAEICELPVRVVQMLCVSIHNSDIHDEEHRLEKVKADVIEHTKKDSLVVLDEIQDLHPTGRYQLSSEWSKYIASHRHEGLDIVLMGQDRRDVHPIWRRRIQRLITFNKLNAVGANNRYRWEVYEATRPEKFKRVTSGVREYEKRYFGSYSSHTAGTDNKSVYSDKRANILHNKALRYGLLAAIVMGWFAVDYLSGFFGDSSKVVNVPASEAKPSRQPVQPAPSKPVAGSAPADPQPKEPDEPPPPLDMFDEQARQFRPRLAGFVALPDRSEFTAQIDIMKSTGHRVDSYTVAALKDLGWRLELRPSGLHVYKDGRHHLVRPWPMDTSYGEIDRGTREAL